MYKGFFVDDEDDDIYVDLLSVNDSGNELGLKLELKEPENITQLSSELFNALPDIVILDYRLDENFKDCPESQYKAGPLAQQLRDMAAEDIKKDFPIVLISAEDKITRYYKPDATTHDLFDKIYVKEKDVSKNNLQCRKELIGLIEGYQLIKSNWSNTKLDKLCSILNLSLEEQYAIDYEELTNAADEAQVPHVLARVLIHDLFTRSGILISWNDIRAKLGVAYNSPQQDELKKCFDHIKYTGAFVKTWERWWRHQFDVKANEIFGRSPTGIPGVERVAALNQQFDLSLEAAKSRYSNSDDELFAFPCVVCEYPTELRHSLAAYDPRAPKFAERKRICWDCVRSDREQGKGIRIAQSDLSLANRIKAST